ncbi:hypothetical protein EXIGLDRAFT_823536 [Exidia glandulosa HHB12029]|uniref:Large ribosomal subunit protein mL43 n=1 Tax=Exidia glandulosa HHB12029 TaxID=1314781 RepID=A0A165PGP1_EXIGL|nr:hypothetical protein EXIGLDRAFT_614841 [Exidia glandulosa HHB12029]KZW02152.1 hypothetical protein EXIGLDRAFT_823536 [Exidia glandulosa HHB12029]
MSRPILRASLKALPSNGSAFFIPQIRKLVFEYCEHQRGSALVRLFLVKQIEQLAHENPHVEFVVKQRNNKRPIVRGLYMNDRDKVIELTSLEPPSIMQKVQLLLDSSGAPIKPLKTAVMSSTPATRGIWSGLHVQETFKI